MPQIGKAGQCQPEGQRTVISSIVQRVGRAFWQARWLWGALIVVILPFNRFGIVEPQELRIAEISRRLAAQLFNADVLFDNHEVLRQVTRSQLSFGELPYTSTALGFALFGPSDASGRVVSLVWAAITIVSIWILLGQFSQRFAQAFGILSLASLPPFIWQARLMLGDAATIAALAMATSGFAIASLRARSLAVKTFWSLIGLTGLIFGQLCRGVLVGVAVPCLAVGIAAIRIKSDALPGSILNAFSKSEGTSEVTWFKTGALKLGGLPTLPALLIVVGCVSVVWGVTELQNGPDGYSFLLSATLTGPYRGGAFGSVLGQFIHAFFPWSTLVPAAIGLVVSAEVRDVAGRSERALASSFVLAIVFTFAAMGAMATRCVSMPFPAVFAVAGLIAVALDWAKRKRFAERAIVATVIAIAVLTYADFENVPETRVLVSGVMGGQVPLAVSEMALRWFRPSLCLLVVGCLPVAMSHAAPVVRPFSAERIIALKNALIYMISGPFSSALALLETMLITTALMLRAHEQGFIEIHAFSSIVGPYATVLKYSWAVLPTVILVCPVVFVGLREASTWLMYGRIVSSSAPRQFTKKEERRSFRVTASVPRVSGALLLGSALLGSGLLLTSGQMPSIASGMSAKSKMIEFERVSALGGTLGLLGMDSGAARYYLRRTPKQFSDVSTAATWLSDADSSNRYLVFADELLGELNSAYRVATKGRNLYLPTPADGRFCLAAGTQVPQTQNYNKFEGILPESGAKLHHSAGAEWGDCVRVEGWQLVDEAGRVVDEVQRGASYRLDLLFHVIGTPSAEWRIFVHLDGPGFRANGDHDPALGQYSMELWLPDDLVLDHSNLELHPTVPPGRYKLYVGFYRGQQRWAVTDGEHADDRVALGEVLVK